MFSNVFAIANRTIVQLKNDRRMMILLVVIPLLVAIIVGRSVPDKRILRAIAPGLLATLFLSFGFLMSGISFMKERSQGTMERLMTSTVNRMDVVFGYLLGFLTFAVVQTLVIFLCMVYVLKIGLHGDLWQLIVFQIVISGMAVSLGVFISAFARNEYQLVQFVPMIILPQIFLCGMMWDVSEMPNYLRWISNLMPLTYAVDGMSAMMVRGQGLTDIAKDVGVTIGFAAGFLLLAASTVNKRTK